MYEEAAAVSSMKRRISKKLLWLFIVLIIILMFLSKTINNFMLPRVNLDSASSGSLIKEIYGQGSVTAKSTIEQYVNVNLPVKYVKVDAGDMVKKGQEIMELDVDDLKASLADEKTKFEQKKIGLDKLIDSGSPKALLSYDKSIELAREKLENPKNAFDELDVKTAPKDVYDAARDNYVNAKLDLDIALNTKTKFINDNRRDVSNTRCDLEAEARRIKGLEDQISKNSIFTAAADGIITELNFTKGTTTNNSKPLFKLVDTTKGFQLKITIDNSLSSYAKVGDKINVTITSTDNESGEGTIAEIRDSEAHKGEKKDLLIDLNIKGLTGGEQGEGYMYKNTAPYRTLIPNGAVYSDNNGDYILVARSTDSPLGTETYLHKVDINVIDSDASKTAVNTDLFPMDKFVVKSTKSIADGSKVIVEK